ncbi:hypothetical protein MKZ87_07015 [Pseudomonas sp. MCal1]|uniref:hypothetical protein n=1 Tax=Pseudomonas sp. MCal1 TaxID=2919887 RepID=UPI0022556FD0|nr:hypothetical protein [Pseudomonas sp. MCal1]MCX4217387.1 hypothetical protein [Pseudomonas sp. MCal1]
MDLATDLPSYKDLYLPVLVALAFWGFKKAFVPAQRFVGKVLRKSRSKELRKAKAIRVDAFAVQRQLQKEGALFVAFMLSAIISMGIMLIAVQTTTSTSRIIYQLVYMGPPLALEVWWLSQKTFVETLLQEAGRLGHGFMRTIPSRYRSPRRAKDREVRQEQIRIVKKTKTTWKQIKQC